MTFLDKVKLTLQWCQDLTEGEMVEARNYSRTYLGFSSVTQADLESIVRLVNPILKHIHSELRIGCSMGEIIPFFTKLP